MTTLEVLRRVERIVRSLAEEDQALDVLARLNEMKCGPTPVLLDEQVVRLKQVVDLGRELVQREKGSPD